jgi:hypothetical protein
MNARQASPLSKPALPALYYLQLLSPHAAARSAASKTNLRARTGAGPRLVRLLHHWPCSDARARAHSNQRTRTLEITVVIQMLKQITSQKLHAKPLTRFWQLRYYDFPLWTEELVTIGSMKDIAILVQP